MINAGFIDFLFTGAVIVPAMLMFGGQVGEAILLLIPMLIAACLFSIYHQQVSADESPARADAAASDRKPHQA
jgi:ABC-type polysaccharide/polyol phosphate export permease